MASELEYYKQAASWESNRVSTALASRRRSYILCIFLLIVAGVQSIALVGLTPLKTVQLEVLVLDKSQGTIQPLQSLAEVQVDIDDVFTKKFITDFMLARENFTFDTAELLYYTAAAFMAPALQTQWGNLWNTDNPESPLNVYKTLGKVRIDINTITLHIKNSGKKDVASVRFRKTISNGDLNTTRAYIATITYKYSSSPTEEAVRRINPIGFMVTEYQVDDEISGLKVDTGVGK
jgi:type IV secretion system protein VirB8